MNCLASMRPAALLVLATCIALQAGAVPPPIQNLQVITVDDSDANGVLDQTDIDVALAACYPGCNLKFLKRTYDDVTMVIGAFPSGFAMFGDGMGLTTLRSPLFGADDWNPLILIESDAPDGVIIQDMTLDGRKSEQVPPLLPEFLPESVLDHTQTDLHEAIQTGPTGQGVIRYDGIIRRVEIIDFVSTAIITWATVGWTIEDNEMHHIGCHQVDEPCGSALDPNPWDFVKDPQPSTPGRKTVGFGVLTVMNTRDTIVRNNNVSNVTKIGFEAFSGASLDCTHPASPRDITFEGNEVWDSQTGYAINGGCDITFRNNVARDTVSTGAIGNIGNGFVCTRGGDGSIWDGNRSEGNRRAGYDLGCADGNLTFLSNESFANCEVAAATDISFRGPSSLSGDWVSGLTITATTSDSPNCTEGLRIQNHSDVAVSGGSVTGGTVRGIWIRGAHNVEIENISVASSNPLGADTGVFFDYGQPVDPGVAPLSQVFVQPTAVVTGFDITAGFTSPYGIDDDDDVAFCSLETTPPTGCDP